jgi:pyruvate/2-oxoglutarate dehydrogenase complex dihydrolipoamide acyltransferase (E2) component
VLATPDLPVGPARAVIVTHLEARGRIDVTVGVRALRSGEVVFWSFDGELSSSDDISVASDAALTFAESLGFLFDEGALGPGSDAAKMWTAWIGGETSSALARGEAANPPSEPTELLLEDVLTDAVIDASEELVSEPEPEPQPIAPARAPEPTAPAAAAQVAPAPAAPAVSSDPPEPTAAKGPKLSKFRTRVGAPAAKPAIRRQPIARIQLVKRRSPEEERRLLLRKIVTSF